MNSKVVIVNSSVHVLVYNYRCNIVKAIYVAIDIIKSAQANLALASIPAWNVKV